MMKYWILASGSIFFMQSWIMACQLDTYAGTLEAYWKKVEDRNNAWLIKEEQDHDAQFAMPARLIMAWLKKVQPSFYDPALHQEYNDSESLTRTECRYHEELDTFVLNMVPTEKDCESKKSAIPLQSQNDQLNAQNLRLHVLDMHRNVLTPPLLHRSIGARTPPPESEL